MKKSTLLSFLALVGPLQAGTLIADFNDLAVGDLGGQAGGSGFTGTWTNTSAGTPAKHTDVIAGDLIAPAATHYAVIQAGTPRSVQNSVGNTTLETRTLATPLTGDTIWFSFLLNQPSATNGANSGTRVGVCFNQATTISAPGNPRVMALGSQLNGWLTGSSQIAIDNVFAANTTYLVLGRIQVSDTGNETLSLWVNPDVNSPGTPLATYSGANFIGVNGITTVSVQSYGGSNGGIIDSFRVSDDTDAFFQVTGSTLPDPALDLAPGSAAQDYQFGTVYAGSVTRTVTFRNDGLSQPITIQNVSLTNDAGGVFSVDNVMPAVGTPILPGETVSIRLKATGATAGTFTGQLAIDTSSDLQDRTLPVTATVRALGAVVNANPTLDAGLTGWTAAVAVTPGIAPGSTGMARVRGRGDVDTADQSDLFGQAIPVGAESWEIDAWFTPASLADFERLTGNAPDGNFQDRSFQFAVLASATPPATTFTDTEAATALIQLAYLPAGNGTEAAGFFAFDGTNSTWRRLNALPAIQGSTDSNGDGRLDAADTLRSYRLQVRGTGFGTNNPAWSVAISGGELTGTATQPNLAYSAAGLLATETPGSFTFTTADVSGISNAQGGYTTPFWVDDVFAYAGARPDPAITVLGVPNLIATDGSSPTGIVTVRNDGSSQNLNLASVQFSDPALSLVTPALPLTVAPGQTAALSVRLDAAALAPDNAVAATASIASNDASQPIAALALTGVVTSPSNLLANWNFETPGLAPGRGDNFAAWTEFDLRTRSVPGILPGSATAVYFDAAGGTTSISQATPALADFELTAGFAILATANRQFNAHLFAGSGHFNLRYFNAVWSAYDGAAWQPLIDMTSSPLATSSDLNFDGDFTDAGESSTAYQIRLTGSGWGGATPAYRLEILNAAGSVIAASPTAFTFFQTAVTTPLSSVRFDNIDGSNPGFWIDDVLLKSTSTAPTAGLAITAFTVDRATGAVSLTFTSAAGAAYAVTASDVLAGFTQVATATGTAGTTTVTFNDPVVITQARRFYRVETR